MAWTTPLTWSTGYLATASDLNTHIRDNEDYLKTKADKLNLLSQSQPARTVSTASIYQNTTGKIIGVCVCAGNVANTLSILCGSTNPPTTSTSRFYTSGVSDYQSTTFFVPPDFYYTASSALTTFRWTEWSVH